jgi:hypothetical protein
MDVQVSVFTSPRNSMAQLYPRTLGSVSLTHTTSGTTVEVSNRLTRGVLLAINIPNFSARTASKHSFLFLPLFLASLLRRLLIIGLSYRFFCPETAGSNQKFRGFPLSFRKISIMVFLLSYENFLSNIHLSSHHLNLDSLTSEST